MRPEFRFLLSVFSVFSTVTPCRSQDFIYYGQLSSWLSANQQTEKFAQLGIRYIPVLSFSAPPTKELFFDIEASVKAFGNCLFSVLVKTGQ